MASEGIGLCSKASRAEVDGEVELGEVLPPMSLMAGQDLGAGEILQILVVSDHIHQRGRALKVVSPVLKGLKDGQQLLIMSVIIQLRGGQSPRIVGYWSELGIGADDRQNASNGIVQGISLDISRALGTQGVRIGAEVKAFFRRLKVE